MKKTIQKARKGKEKQNGFLVCQIHETINMKHLNKQHNIARNKMTKRMLITHIGSISQEHRVQLTATM